MLAFSAQKATCLKVNGAQGFSVAATAEAPESGEWKEYWASSNANWRKFPPAAYNWHVSGSASEAWSGGKSEHTSGSDVQAAWSKWSEWQQETTSSSGVHASSSNSAQIVDTSWGRCVGGCQSASVPAKKVLLLDKAIRHKPVQPAAPPPAALLAKKASATARLPPRPPEYPPPQALLIARARPQSLFPLGKRNPELSPGPSRGQVNSEERPIGVYLQEAIAQKLEDSLLRAGSFDDEAPDDGDCSPAMSSDSCDDVFEDHECESLDAGMAEQ